MVLQLLFRIPMLVLHVVLTFYLVSSLGDYASSKVETVFAIQALLAIVVLGISLLIHIANFVSFIKKLTK